MNIVQTIQETQNFSNALRREGKKIAFVPTMGFFHKGHVKLMEEGKKLGDILAVSIFVNPTQFGSGEDYLEYPQNLEADKIVAEAVGVDLLFLPSSDEMYPEGFQSYVTVEEVTKNLCGFSRPGHFRGVATVVLKLFNVVKPHVAFFGEKDYQQLETVKRMVKDLNLDIEIRGVPIAREDDGLAMSSRNSYLSGKERKAARSLYASLERGREVHLSGVKDCKTIIEEVRRVIDKESCATIEYVKICDPETIEDISEIQETALLALAVKIGKARLIDNCILQ
jgi:pantoate--beta-alanine ligase